MGEGKQIQIGYRRPMLNTVGQKEACRDGTGPLEAHLQTYKTRNRDRDNLLPSPPRYPVTNTMTPRTHTDTEALSGHTYNTHSTQCEEAGAISAAHR